MTALCVLSMLIVLTDIMLRPSNVDRLIWLSPVVIGLVGSLVLSGHSHRQLMQRFECMYCYYSAISAGRRRIQSVEYWYLTFIRGIQAYMHQNSIVFAWAYSYEHAKMVVRSSNSANRAATLPVACQYASILVKPRIIPRNRILSNISDL